MQHMKGQFCPAKYENVSIDVQQGGTNSHGAGKW
jgi:hypothetical protein